MHVNIQMCLFEETVKTNISMYIQIWYAKIKAKIFLIYLIIFYSLLFII